MFNILNSIFLDVQTGIGVFPFVKTLYWFQREPVKGEGVISNIYPSIFIEGKHKLLKNDASFQF